MTTSNSTDNRQENSSVVQRLLQRNRYVGRHRRTHPTSRRP